MFSFEALAFFLSSLIISTLVYLRLPPNVLQIITATLLTLLLILFSRLLPTRQSTPRKLPRLILLLLSSLFVQVLVISTGGFLSPFLILLHLFALGTSFLLSLGSSIIFLLLAILTLGGNLFLNESLLKIFQEDPGPTILYFTSFIVVIPLGQFMTKSYKVKDKLAQVLKEHVQIGEKREESILRSLGEIIIVTDRNLNIISLNEAADNIFGAITSQALHHPLLETIPLLDTEGNPANIDSLSYSTLITDQTARIIQGLFIQATNESQPHPVIIHARPIVSSQREVTQIVFIITDARQIRDPKRHSNLEPAKQKYRILAEDLKKMLQGKNLGQSVVELELLNKLSEDLLLTSEIEDHPIKAENNSPNAAKLGLEAVQSKQKLAQALGISLKFVLPPQETAESALLNLSSSNFPAEALPVSNFTVPTDGHWLKVALEKLLEMAVFLAVGEQKAEVILSPSRNTESVFLVITTPSTKVDAKQKEDLFREYYGNLSQQTRLSLGSGLEGFLVHTITQQLNISLQAKINSQPPYLAFSLKIPKTPSRL